MHKLVIENIADRSTECFDAKGMLLIPQTSNFAVSLTLKNQSIENAGVSFVKGAYEGMNTLKKKIK